MPSGPTNATIQQLVFLNVVLDDADGIEIMHNSWQFCVQGPILLHPISFAMWTRVSRIFPLSTSAMKSWYSAASRNHLVGGIFARGTIPLPSSNHERIVSFCLNSNPCSTHPEPVRVFVPAGGGRSSSCGDRSCLRW